MTNKPSRRSIRLHGYDYSQQGLYYIMICTQDRARLFGNVINGDMVLNEVGEHTQECWLNIPNHLPNVIVHDYIIMPNHIHGIIEIVGAKDFSPVINDMRAYLEELSKTTIFRPYTGRQKQSVRLLEALKLGSPNTYANIQIFKP